jgi:hypothetical protein
MRAGEITSRLYQLGQESTRSDLSTSSAQGHAGLDVLAPWAVLLPAGPVVVRLTENDMFRVALSAGHPLGPPVFNRSGGTP